MIDVVRYLFVITCICVLLNVKLIICAHNNDKIYGFNCTENDTRWIGEYWAIRAVITDLLVILDVCEQQKHYCEQAEYIYYELSDQQNLSLLHYVADLQSTMAQSFTYLQKEFVFVGSVRLCSFGSIQFLTGILRDGI